MNGASIVAVVALLGAERSGKTTLAHALAASLAAQGRPATVVADGLRDWCGRHGRWPEPSEYETIAAAQSAAIAAACAQWSDARDAVVLSDTTALSVAIDAGGPQPGAPWQGAALAQHRAYTATLVTACDLPWQADEWLRKGPAHRHGSEQRLRSALAGAGLRWQVVYGHGPARLANALRALRLVLGLPAAPLQRSARWACDQCSDPACEQRLFRRLFHAS